MTAAGLQTEESGAIEPSYFGAPRSATDRLNWFAPGPAGRPERPNSLLARALFMENRTDMSGFPGSFR